MKTPAFIVSTMGIGMMMLAMIIGPVFSHPDYASLRHTTSQLAGNNMPAAWIMRTGFVGFGAGTAIAARWQARANPARTVALLIFGLGMVATAVWPHDPIMPELGNDAADDRAHSIAASVVGTAFAVAVVCDLAARGFPRRDLLGWAALAASVVLPVMMMALPASAGLWQRLMFGISFLWISRLNLSPH